MEPPSPCSDCPGACIRVFITSSGVNKSDVSRLPVDADTIFRATLSGGVALQSLADIDTTKRTMVATRCIVPVHAAGVATNRATASKPRQPGEAWRDLVHNARTRT